MSRRETALRKPKGSAAVLDSVHQPRETFMDEFRNSISDFVSHKSGKGWKWRGDEACYRVFSLLDQSPIDGLAGFSVEIFQTE